MKNLFISCIALLFFASCSSHKTKAIEDAKQVQELLKEETPGTIPTSDDGYFMKAKIDGKQWEADAMMPLEVQDKIHGFNNGESISLPYNRKRMITGEIIKFENHPVNLFLNDEVGIWSSHKGEMVITKVDEKSAEGTFYFTASDAGNNKTIEVTDGFFRILFK